VLGFISCLFLCAGEWLDFANEICLRKVAGFFPQLGFAQDKSLVFFLSLVYAATAQYMIYIC
jgi:hypothetical protein